MLNPILASLDWGTRLEGDVITYSFLAGGSTLALESDDDDEDEAEHGAGTKILEGWTPYEMQQARLALSLFADVTPLTFVEVDDPEQAALRFALFDFEEPGLLGWAIPPGDIMFGQRSGLAAFNFTSPAWSREAGGALDQGGYGFITLTHEFGHLFGLAHPHDDGGGSPLMPGVIKDEYHGNGGSTGDFEFNQGVYTMMSYNDGWKTGPMPLSPSQAFGWAKGPMALDIAVLQQKYGAPAPQPDQPGTVYVLDGADESGVGYRTIWTSSGDNVIRYDGTRDAVINLQAASLEQAWGGGGWLSYVKDVHGGLTIAHGVEVSTAISGAGNDVLIGNALDNVFDPGAGQNQIRGNGGFDTVIYTGTRTDYSIEQEDGAWGISADDGSRQDLLHGVRGLQFEDRSFLVEAVADTSLAIGTLYHALLGRDPDAEGFLHWTVNAFADDNVGAVADNMTRSDEFQNGRGLLDDTVFVQTLYADLLDREADAQGLQYWTTSLQADAMTRGEVALSFSVSDEFDDALLDDLLTAISALGDLWA